MCGANLKSKIRNPKFTTVGMGTITCFWREVLARNTGEGNGETTPCPNIKRNKEDEWLPKTALVHFEKLNF